MSYVQLAEGGFQVVYPLRLVDPVVRSCQSFSHMAGKLFTVAFTLTSSRSSDASILLAYCLAESKNRRPCGSQHKRVCSEMLPLPVGNRKQRR